MENSNVGVLGFEKELWKATDKLRIYMEA